MAGSISSVYSDFISLEQSLDSGDVRLIWSKFKVLGDDVFGSDLAVMGAAADPAEEANLRGCCDRCVEKCHRHLNKPAPAAGQPAPAAAEGEAGFGLPGNPLLTLLLQTLASVLPQLLDRLFKRPAAASTPDQAGGGSRRQPR